MRSLILSLLFCAISVINYGQADADCAIAEMTPTALTPPTVPPITVTLDPAWTGDLDYNPTMPAGPHTVGYYSFTITGSSGYFNLNFANSAGSPITSDISIGLSDDSGGSACPMMASMTEIYNGALMAGMTVTGDCTFLSPGTVYTLAFAVTQTFEGDVEFSLTPATVAGNDACNPAVPSLAIGANTGNNTCSDGLVWYQYTVVNGGTVSVAASMSATGNDISNPVITQTILDACGNPDEGVTSWTCLPVGTIIYIEAGDDTAPVEQGDFTLTIVDDPTVIPNELCTDVTPAVIPTCQTTELTTAGTDNTTMGACPESEDIGSCGIFNTESTVWFTFTTDANAVSLDVELIGNTMTNPAFALVNFPGACPLSGSVIGGCVLTGSLTNAAVAPNTTYYIVVATDGGTDGTFTLNVTPLNPPANDACDIALNPSLMNGVTVNGTTGCAGNDFDICGQGTTSHDVFYTYTNTTGANTNLTITVNGNMATTGTAATDISVALYEDCAGTVYDAFPSECNTLGTPFTVDCVPPMPVAGGIQQLVIVVSSPDGFEGDFDITVAEDATSIPSNDLCSNPLPLMVANGCTPNVESLSNVNACPELYDIGGAGCGNYLTNSVVFYELTLPANSTGFEISGLGAGVLFSLFDNSCPTPIVVNAPSGTCVAADGDIYDGLMGGNTYLVGLTLAGGLEGSIDFTWTPVIDVMNDDCDAGTNPELTNGTPLATTNACADGDFDFCGLANATSHGVWYTYNNNTGGNVDLDITVTADMSNGTPISGLEIAILDNTCTGTLYQPEDCNAALATPYEVNCIADGDQIMIHIASTDGEEGDFNIVVNEDTTQPPSNNDECADASAIDIDIPTTCEFHTINVDNTSACPEDFDVSGGCDFSADPTVWYSFTTPMTPANVTVEFQNIDVAGGGYLVLFDNTCAALPTPISGCESGAPITGPFMLASNTTYHIAFGSMNEGPTTFDIQINVPPVNDECDMAEAVTGNVALAGTTLCASQETPSYNSMVCADTDEENTVWFTYTVNAGEKGFNLTINGAGASPITMGDINAVVFETTSPGCVTDASTFQDEDCLTLNTVSEQFECIGPGDYVIRISTSDMNAGDFEILIEPLAEVQPNDLCSNPLTLAPTDCVWLEETANTVGACPELFDHSMNCGFDQVPVVWYEFTAPTGGTNLDVALNSASAGTPFLAIFEGNQVDCSDLSGVEVSNCFSGIFDQLGDIGSGLVDIVPGNTYLIGVGSQDLAGASITFEIKVIVPPTNDECTAADVLTAGVGTSGTTACATQEDPATYDEGACPPDIVNTVWYEYTVPAGDKGFTLRLLADAVGGFTNPANVVVYESTSAGCDASGATYVGEDCVNSSTVTNEFECVGPGTYLIRVSTSTDNEGGFEILITALTQDNLYDDCSDPNTELNPGLDCEWMLSTANTQLACPESFDPDDCGFDDYPVIWYEITAPANAVELDLQVNSGGGSNYFLNLFESNPPNDCSNLTSLSGCIFSGGFFDNLADIGETPIAITGGNTYLLGVGAGNSVAGTTIDFGIKWITPPDNDICDPNAETLTAGATLVGETTACATEPLNGACPADQTNTVWYEYIMEADVKEITIDITNYMNNSGTGANTFSLLAVDGCASLVLFNQANGTPAEYCGGEGENLIRLSCLDLMPGESIFFMVSSSADNEGTFDITLNTSVPECVYTNDECADAIAIDGGTPLVTDADCTPLSGCNDLACVEFDWSAICGGVDVLNSVFYTFTTDANADDAFVNIEVLNGQGGELDNPGALLFEGGCGGPLVIGNCGDGAGGEYNSGPLGGPGQIMANTTYTVVIFNSNDMQNGGTFDLCVEVSSGCVNDEPCDAFVLDPGVTVTNPASSVGCTPELDVSGCGPAQNEATLWYEITVPTNSTGFNVTLTNLGAPNGVTGDVSIAVGQLINCNAIDPGEVIYTDCGGFTTNGGIHEIECAPEGGTFYIQIGSEDMMEAGDFEITVDPVTDPDPANDICSRAFGLDIPDFCEYFPFDGTLNDACPEIFDIQGCEFSQNPAVWYQIIIPADPVVSQMDIRVMGGINGIMLGIFTFDCETLMGTEAQLLDGTNVGCTMDLGQIEGIDVMAGEIYYILVSSSTESMSDFTLEVQLQASPENDSPCNSDDNPPIDLGGGGHTGTTCCAIGFNDDPTQDLQNQMPCNDATDDNAVWYTYSPSPDEDGFLVTVEGTGISGNMTVQQYWGAPNAGCGGTLTVGESSCTSQSAELEFGNCPPNDGDIIFIKVATADEDCGEFTIDISPATCGNFADECFDLGDETPIEPVTNPEFMIDYFCVTSCLTYGCPEVDAMGGCPQFVESPTVWFQVTADDLAAQMFSYVEPAGNWEAVWSVWSGPDCDNLEIVNFGGSPPCSDGDGTPELHQTSVFDDEENYWIAVTADPGSIPSGGIQDGNFELCVATTINAIICLGELEGGDCDDESLVMEVIDRENDLPLDPDGDGLAGPFCAGEEIDINISFFYDASESGADWLIGFVPIFGNGWDMENFDYAGNAPTGNGGAAEWYEEGGDCAPIIQEPNPILCTFVNADGNLQICNQLCSPCADCPESGMEEGDPLPSGYFWVTNGGNAGCDNDCSPGEGWGIGSVTSQIDWSFTLTVKTFDNVEDCFENNDLSISFQTFSDGVGGCWEDPVGECILDRAMFSPPWKIECESPPAVEGEDEEICHDGLTDIFVSTVDGSVTTVIVEVEDNPNVTGETLGGYVFPGGTGTIADDLFNGTDDIQIVTYTVYSEDPTLPCPGPRNEIEVTIYPELRATFPPDVYVCDGDCTDIFPMVIGGQGEPYTYEWSTGATTPSINICPTVPTTYVVTVEDALGCMDVAEVEVDVKPPVEFDLGGDQVICQDGEYDDFNPEYTVTALFSSGSAPFSVNWTTSSASLVGNPFGETFVINEEASNAFAGPYELCAEVIDFFGCMNTECIMIDIKGELIMDAEILNLECGSTTADIRVTALDHLGNEVPNFTLFGGCPAEDYLDDGFQSTGVITFQNLDLLSYTCFTVEATSDDGCVNTIEIEIPLTEGTPIEISGTPEICIGDDASITIDNASEFSTFVWTPDIGDSGDITFTPDSTATYTVEATDLTGCTSVEIFTVVVNELPNIGLSGTTTFCEGGSATITASGGVTYNWTGAGTVAGNEYTADAAETVSLEVIDDNGCINDTTVTFTQENVITINLGDVNICDNMGDTVFVNGNYSNFSWIDVANSTILSTTNFFVITGPGMFSVSAIDDASGCDALGSFEVMNFNTPLLMVSDTVEVCRQDSGIDSLCVNFTAQVSTDGMGSWSQVGTIPSFTFSDWPRTSVCFEDIPAGCYAFTYTTDNAMMPCDNVTDTMYVCVKACPCPVAVTDPIDPLCNNETTDLDDAVVSTDPGTWTVISGPPSQDLNGIITGTIFDANDLLPGDYVVEFNLDNPGGPACTMTSSQETITVYAAPMVSVIGSGEICNIASPIAPLDIDLYTLIDVDAADGGTWSQVDNGSETVTISGSTVNSSELTSFPQTLIFEYVSGVEAGSPCPPAVIQVEVIARDCNCPVIDVLTDTLCNDGVAILLDNLLNNPDGLSGTWDAPNGGLSGTNMFDPNGLTSGQYPIEFTLDVSPGPNCPLTYSNVILVRRKPVAELGLGTPPCNEDTGNGSTVINLFDWLEDGYSLGTWTQTGGSPDLPIVDGGAGIANVDFDQQPINSTFTFTYMTSTALEPCTDISVDVEITVVDCNCPPIILLDPADVCDTDGLLDLPPLAAGSDPGSFTLETVGGTDVSDDINLDTMVILENLNPGTYVLIYTLNETVAGACTQSLSVELNVSQYIEVEGFGPVGVCNNPDGNDVTSLDFTTLVSNAGVGVWSEPSGASGVDISDLVAQMDVSFIGVPAGQYTYLYTIDNDDPCEDFVYTLIVNVTDDCDCPTPTPGPIPDVCSTEGPVDLTQYDDSNNPGTWASDELTINGGNSLVTDGVAAGIYDLIYIVTEPLPDCPDSIIVSFLIGAPANTGTPAEDYLICEGESEVVDLTTLLEGADMGGVWTAGSNAGFDAGNATFTSDGQPAGTYTFDYTIAENDPCPDESTTVTVVIEPNPVADAGTDAFLDCDVTTANLGGPLTSTGPGFIYSWTNEAGDEVSTEPTYVAPNEGIYTLTVIDSINGCMDSDEVVVDKSDDLPTMDVIATDITCFGGDDGGVTLSNQSGGDGNYMYSLNGGTPTDDPLTFGNLPAGDYTVSIMDGNGCSQPYPFTIEEPAQVTVDAGPDIVGEVGESFTLSIQPVGSNIDSIIWSVLDGELICASSDTSCATIEVTPVETVTGYYVQVFDENGCEAFDEVQIRLDQIVDVIFPNVISANGDGANDIFYVKSEDVQTVLSMKVFDRWGEKVFEGENLPPRDPSVGWDGTFNERKVVPGVYVFISEILFIDGTRETFSGDVTVIETE